MSGNRKRLSVKKATTNSLGSYDSNDDYTAKVFITFAFFYNFIFNF